MTAVHGFYGYFERQKKLLGMNCWHCGTELIWGSDFDGADMV